MKDQKRHLLVEVAGKEVNLDINDNALSSTSLGYEIASELAKQHNVYADFGECITFTARVFNLTISKGAIQKTFLKTVDVVLCQRSMNADNYKSAMESLLGHLPQAARYFIHNQAWDRGHSYGYDECYNIAQNLVDEVETLLKNLPKSS